MSCERCEQWQKVAECLIELIRLYSGVPVRFPDVKRIHHEEVKEAFCAPRDETADVNERHLQGQEKLIGVAARITGKTADEIRKQFYEQYQGPL